MNCRQLPMGDQLRRRATLSDAPLDVCKACPQDSLSDTNRLPGSRSESCLKRVLALGSRLAVQSSVLSQSVHSCPLKRTEWFQSGLMICPTASSTVYRCVCHACGGQILEYCCCTESCALHLLCVCTSLRSVCSVNSQNLVDSF